MWLALNGEISAAFITKMCFFSGLLCFKCLIYANSFSINLKRAPLLEVQPLEIGNRLHLIVCSYLVDVFTKNASGKEMILFQFQRDTNMHLPTCIHCQIASRYVQ